AVADLHVSAGVSDAAAARGRVINNGTVDNYQRCAVKIHNAAAGVLYPTGVTHTGNGDNVFMHRRLRQLDEAAVRDSAAGCTCPVVPHRDSREVDEGALINNQPTAGYPRSAAAVLNRNVGDVNDRAVVSENQ